MFIPLYLYFLDWLSFNLHQHWCLLYAYTHTFSLCSYSATLTLAFVNQIGITGFCQCARGWERNIKLKFWLWIVSNLNFMYQCFHNWHVVFLLILQYEWKFNHTLCFDPVTSEPLSHGEPSRVAQKGIMYVAGSQLGNNSDWMDVNGGDVYSICQINCFDVD